MAEHWYLLRGEMDIATAPGLRADLATVISRNDAHLIIDCAGLTFIDSTGVAVLLEAQRDLHATGRHMLLVNVAATPRRTLELLGLADLLEYDHEPAI